MANVVPCNEKAPAPFPDAEKTLPARSWKPSRRLLCAASVLVTLITVSLFAVITVANFQVSAPGVRPLSVAFEVSSSTRRISAHIEAEVKESSGAHRVRMQSATCEVTIGCGSVPGDSVRCPLLIARAGEFEYPQDNWARCDVDLARTWPENIRGAIASQWRGLGVTCMLDLSVDLYKTGINLAHTLEWTHYEDVKEDIANGAPEDVTDDIANGSTKDVTDDRAEDTSGSAASFSIRRNRWSLDPTSKVDANVSGVALLVAEMKLLEGPLLRAIEAMTISVKADISYVEAHHSALQGRLLANAEVQIARNEPGGYAVLSLPFEVQGRVIVPQLAEYLLMGSGRPDLIKSTDNEHVYYKEHSLSFVPLSDGKSVVSPRGAALTLDWRRSIHHFGRSGGSNTSEVALLGPEKDNEATLPPARRLLGFFGLEKAIGPEFSGIETHHRIAINGDESIGIDLRMSEGPPFTVDLGLAVMGAPMTDGSGNKIGSKSAIIVNASLVGTSDLIKIGANFTDMEGGTTFSGTELKASVDSSFQVSLDYVLDIKDELAVKVTLDTKAEKGSISITDLSSPDRLVAQFTSAGATFNASLEGMAITGRANSSGTALFLSSKDHSEDMGMDVKFYRTIRDADTSEYVASLAMRDLKMDWQEMRVSGSNQTTNDMFGAMEGHLALTNSHGRRRTSAAGGTSSMKAVVSMVSKCQLAGDDATWDLQCCSLSGMCYPESCCGDFMTSLSNSLTGLTPGETWSAEGVDIVMTDLPNAAGSWGDLQISAYLDKEDSELPHLELKFLGATLSSTPPSASVSAEVWENATQRFLMLTGAFKEEKDGEDSKYSLDLVMVPSGYDKVTISVFLKDGSPMDEIGFYLITGSEKVIEASVWGSLDSINMGVEVGDDTSTMVKASILDSKASSSDDFDVVAYLDIENKREANVHFDWVLATGKLSVQADIMPGTEDELSVMGTYLLSAADPSVRSAEGTVKANGEVVTSFKGSASNGNKASPATVQLEVWDDDRVAASLFKVAGQMTTFEQSFSAPKRIILLTSPVAGSVTLDVRNDEGSERLVAFKLGVKDEKNGDGSQVTGSAELVSPLSEAPLTLTMVFDTSVSTKMALSADLVTDGESLVSLKGDCPYAGDFMEGDLALKRGDDSQVLHLKASKGFLPQKMKESGYDALWLSLGTTIDRARIDVSDLYFERGPDVAWSGIGWKFKLCDVDGDQCVTVTAAVDVASISVSVETENGAAELEEQPHPQLRKSGNDKPNVAVFVVVPLFLALGLAVLGGCVIRRRRQTSITGSEGDACFPQTAIAITGAPVTTTTGNDGAVVPEVPPIGQADAIGPSFSLEKVSPEEYKSLEAMLTDTFRDIKTRDRRDAAIPRALRLVKASRVENWALWERYCAARHGIQTIHTSGCTPVATFGGKLATESGLLETTKSDLHHKVNEAFLWHGTSPGGAQGISQSGFKLDLAGSNAGTMYGKGVYLAECSSKSDEYASDDKTGIYKDLFCLLLCRVTLGEVLHLTNGGDAVHPMIKAGIESQAYDSVLGDRAAAVGTYREFVTYNEDQVYPAYILIYERLE